MSKHSTKDMGQRIRTRRKSLAIKQYDLAERLGISNNHLSAIENGTQNTTIDVLIKICDELQVTPDYLLLGSMHSNNVPQDIVENLKLCSREDIELAKVIVNAMVERNQKKWNEKNYI